MNLTVIKYAVIAFVVGLAIGGYFGWKQKSLIIEANQVRELAQVRKDDAKAVDQSYKKDEVLEDKKEVIRTQKVYLTKEIIKYVPETIIQSDNNVACPSPTLNFGAVGLLDAARTGEDFYAAEWSDAEIQTPTEIGLQELSIAETDLATEYRELAANHDTLVDAVNQYRAEQLKRLNK